MVNKYKDVFTLIRKWKNDRLIPLILKEYADIEKDIVSIGVLSRVEIWSKDKWNEYNESDVDFDSIAEKMSDLGI